MAGRITGRVEVLLNGELLLNKAGATATGIGISGEPSYDVKEVMTDVGIAGFAEEPIVATCEVTITDRDDISLDAIARVFQNGTVNFRAAKGGKSYTMQAATCTRNFTVTAGEGDTTVKFVGSYWTEDVAG